MKTLLDSRKICDPQDEIFTKVQDIVGNKVEVNNYNVSYFVRLSV